MISYGDLRAWDAAAVGDAASRLRSDLAVQERACDELETTAVPGSWVGLASLGAQWRRGALVSRLSGHTEGVSAFERAVYGAQARVEAITRSVEGIDAAARRQEFEVDGAGTVTDVSSPQQFTSIRAAEAHSEERVRLRDALVTRIETVLREAAELDTELLWSAPRDSFSDGDDEVDDPDDMGVHTPLGGPVPLDDDAFDLSEIMQGSIGDCWFLASAGAVGAVDPDWIRDHIRANSDGSYTVTFYEDGEPVEVRVEGSVIDEGVRDSDDDSPSWLSIYEKAAAAHLGGSYDDIDADQVSRGLEMVTGRDTDSDGDMSLEDIRDGIAEGRIHVVSTEDGEDSGWNPFDTAVDDDRVVPNHAYVIDRVEDIDGDGDLEVHVVNPWGPDGGELDGEQKSGDLWLSEDDFHGSFDTTTSIAGR